ncbi:hypothetical protein AMECASPLE_024417 [Ameca splendens]|uniref:Uncharacterized protein n=1 Tax=Ameca splendens TaxID=208324 RepID=A0ABV0XHH9_9TELE
MEPLLTFSSLCWSEVLRVNEKIICRSFRPAPGLLEARKLDSTAAFIFLVLLIKPNKTNMLQNRTVWTSNPEIPDTNYSPNAPWNKYVNINYGPSDGNVKLLSVVLIYERSSAVDPLLKQEGCSSGSSETHFNSLWNLHRTCSAPAIKSEILKHRTEMEVLQNSQSFKD